MRGGIVSSVCGSRQSSHKAGLAGHPYNTVTCWIHFILHGVFICAYLFYDVRQRNVKHVIYFAHLILMTVPGAVRSKA
jgi:hypothetical protein